jgi:tetratricopeptide (TPR) repeat protein
MGPRGCSFLPGKLFPAVALIGGFLPIVFLFWSLPLGGQTTATAPAPDPLQRHYDAARTYGLSGDQERAAVEYKAFLAEALHRMGNGQATAGEFKAATALYEEALSFAPVDRGLLLDQASVYLQEGKLTEAKSFAERAASSGPPEAKTEYVLGRIFHGLGDYAVAKEHLEKAVGATPTLEIGMALGATYLKLHDLDKARLLFDEMLAGLGDTPQLRLLISRAYRDDEYWDQAIDELKKAAAEHPKAIQLHYFIGLAYMGRDNDAGIPEAIPEFRAELENNPKDYRSHYFLGYSLLKQHDLKGAEAELTKAAALDTQNPDPWVYLGQLYAGDNRNKDAEAALRKAIALTKEGSTDSAVPERAHYILARILLDTGRREEGLKELAFFGESRKKGLQTQITRQQGIPDAPDLNEAGKPREESASSTEDRKNAQVYIDQLKPAIADAYNNLGVGAAGRQEFAGAVLNFQKAAKWNPMLETVDRNLGMAAFYGGQYQEAIAPLERQLQRHPDDTRARAALGLSYFSLDNYGKTLETLQRIPAEVNGDEGLSSAYLLSLVKTGKYDEGMERLKILETTNPESADVHLLLGEAYAEQKIFATAIEEFRRALAIDSTAGRAHFLLGLALIHQGSLGEAVPELRTALQLNPEDVSAKYHLAFALLQTQQKEEAQKLLLQVIQQDAHHADAYYQLGKLQLEDGESKQAIANLETASKLSPESEYMHYQLAMAYRRDSRTQDAEREMKLYETLKDHRRGSHEQSQPN